MHDQYWIQIYWPQIKKKSQSYVNIKGIHPIIERLVLDTEYIPNDIEIGLLKMEFCYLELMLLVKVGWNEDVIF